MRIESIHINRVHTEFTIENEFSQRWFECKLQMDWKRLATRSFHHFVRKLRV